MNAKDTIALIATLATAEEVNALLKDEARQSVLAAGTQRLKELEAAGNTSAAGDDAGDEGDPPAGNDADQGGGPDTDADTDTDEADAPTGADAPAKGADQPPPRPDHVITGKGREREQARYVVVAPTAKGMVGFGNRMYTRAEVAASPALMEALYKAGSRVVRRAK